MADVGRKRKEVPKKKGGFRDNGAAYKFSLVNVHATGKGGGGNVQHNYES